MKTEWSFDSWLCFYWAVLILTLPVSWIAAAGAAAVFHELCHMTAVRLLGGQIQRLRISIGGASMEASYLSPWGELFSILAGPLGSLSLFLLIRFLPKLALCGLIQGSFNLIPAFRLDGSRILEKLLDLLAPEHARVLLPMIRTAVLLAMAAGFLMFFRYLHNLP